MLDSCRPTTRTNLSEDDPQVPSARHHVHSAQLPPGKDPGHLQTFGARRDSQIPSLFGFVFVCTKAISMFLCNSVPHVCMIDSQSVNYSILYIGREGAPCPLPPAPCPLPPAPCPCPCPCPLPCPARAGGRELERQRKRASDKIVKPNEKLTVDSADECLCPSWFGCIFYACICLSICK